MENDMFLSMLSEASLNMDDLYDEDKITEDEMIDCESSFYEGLNSDILPSDLLKIRKENFFKFDYD